MCFGECKKKDFVNYDFGEVIYEKKVLECFSNLRKSSPAFSSMDKAAESQEW